MRRNVSRTSEPAHADGPTSEARPPGSALSARLSRSTKAPRHPLLAAFLGELLGEDGPRIGALLAKQEGHLTVEEARALAVVEGQTRGRLASVRASVRAQLVYLQLLDRRLAALEQGGARALLRALAPGEAAPPVEDWGSGPSFTDSMPAEEMKGLPSQASATAVARGLATQLAGGTWSQELDDVGLLRAAWRATRDPQPSEVKGPTLFQRVLRHLGGKPPKGGSRGEAADPARLVDELTARRTAGETTPLAEPGR